MPLPTVRELVQWGARALADQGVPEAQREAELLLTKALGCTRAWVYAHPEHEVAEPETGRLRHWLARRARREPLRYILGEQEFYGLAFHVDPRVLIPRPETEMLVEAGLAFLARQPRARVADLCTGSGCVAVAVAVHAPAAAVFAGDASAEALAVAQANAARHGVAERVCLVQGDLWAPFCGQFDLVLANPPYIARGELPGLMPEVRDFEPVAALVAGDDGLEVIRRLLQQAPARLAPGGALYLEMGAQQGAAVCALAEAAFPGARISVRRDLAGLDRMLAVETE